MPAGLGAGDSAIVNAVVQLSRLALPTGLPTARRAGARARGIAPAHRDHPAYQFMTDRDNDCIVCE